MCAPFRQLDMSFERVPYDWEHRAPWLDLPFPIAEYEQRVARLRAQMRPAGVDALIVHGGPGLLNGDVRWISNYVTAAGNTIVVVPGEGDLMLTTDSIFHSAPMHSFVHQTWIRDVRPADLPGTVANPRDISHHVRDFLVENRMGRARLGVVGGRFIAAPITDMIRAELPDVELVSAQLAFWAAKQIKSNLEIELIEEAGRATAAGLEAAIAAVRPGATERAVSAAAHAAMAADADSVAWCFVVGGPRSGLKHLLPTRRAFQEGDLVFMDMGVEHQGYVTDTARTLCAGRAGGVQRSILQCGLDMFESVLSAARPGVRVVELQHIAQSVAEDCGLGEHYWPTGFGHGIGTSVAELPSLHWNSETELQPGHVFALEPMVVVPELGCGVMEDQILITQEGARSLTPARKKTW